MFIYIFLYSCIILIVYYISLICMHNINARLFVHNT
jgi:hypothetical protein